MVEKITTVAGSTIFVKVKMIRDKNPETKRLKRNKPTTEKVAKINQKNAERELSMILNNNFKHGNLHLALTYKEMPSFSSAQKALNKFIRVLRRELKKAGEELKAVYVTEYLHKRIHHHVVVNTSNLELIEKIWDQGIVKVAALDKTGDYRKLANYLIKETSKTFQDPDAFSKRRFNTTRTIVRPIAKKEKVKAKYLFEGPKEIKDYYIDKDSVFQGTNPFDGKPYMEYVLIAYDPEQPRITKWKRGKIKKSKEPNYSKWLRDNTERQIDMLCPF